MTSRLVYQVYHRDCHGSVISAFVVDDDDTIEFRCSVCGAMWSLDGLFGRTLRLQPGQELTSLRHDWEQRDDVVVG